MNDLKNIKFGTILLIIVLFVGLYFTYIGNTYVYKYGFFGDYEGNINCSETDIIHVTSFVDCILIFFLVLPNIVGNFSKKISQIKFFYIGDFKWTSQ